MTAAPNVVPGQTPEQFIAGQLRTLRPREWPLSIGGGARDAMNIATRRAARSIGPLMAYQALIRALDALCEALGESDALVQQLREKDRG